MKFPVLITFRVFKLLFPALYEERTHLHGEVFNLTVENRMLARKVIELQEELGMPTYKQVNGDDDVSR